MSQSILDEILHHVRERLEQQRRDRPLQELEAQALEAPPVRPFAAALEDGFGLIAEIKQCSPSMGEMRRENVEEAPEAYAGSPAVKAVSLLTEPTYFGQDLEDFRRLREAVGKPALRKDFIFDPYQVVEARAYGADAILLMSQHLTVDKIIELTGVAKSLGMDVLLECFTPEQIEQTPGAVSMVGVNSRTFSAGRDTYQKAREHREQGGQSDVTTDTSNFSIISHLKIDAIRVAESGISPDTIPRVRELGYQAALVGTSLLLDERGIRAALADFEQAITACRP